MESGGRAGREATPVDHALDALTTALDHLVKVVEDGGLDCYDQAGMLGFAASSVTASTRSYGRWAATTSATAVAAASLPRSCGCPAVRAHR